MKPLISVIFFLLFTGCTGVNEFSPEPYFQTNFDDVAGWIPEEQLVFGNAHSGNCAIMVDSLTQFGVLWKRSLVRLSKKSLTKLRVASYVKLASKKNNACIVVSIDANGKNLYWNSIDFKNFNLDSRSWSKIEGFVEFPVVQQTDAFLTIYLWGRDGSSVILDDLEMEFSI